MGKNIKKAFIISGIIPATLLFILSLSFFPILILELDNYKDFFICFGMFLGMIGYFGLWRNLLKDNSHKGLNILLLLIGIIGYSVFIAFEDPKRILNWVLEFEETGEILLFIWPILVTIVIITANITSLSKLRE